MSTPLGLNQKLADAISALRQKPIAIALDFDGVCKLFTEHKHQIMSTCLFLHLREFQRIPFEVYRKAYIHINFRSADYAGKERFLCVNALAAQLHEQGYDCSLPGLHDTVAQLQARGLKLSEHNLQIHAGAPDVARVLEWSREVNLRVAQLTEIGLTPGIREHILNPFKTQADFYVVSTATEAPLKQSLEKEGVTFIRRYLGQETATKAEALTALGHAGYEAMVMFGDSLEDSRASHQAMTQVPPAVTLLFVPVIPGNEKYCFEIGQRIVNALKSHEIPAATQWSRQLEQEFAGREVGAQGAAPMSIH